MYEPATAEITLNRACGDLLTSLGMVSLFPQRAAEIARTPAPQIDWPT